MIDKNILEVITKSLPTMQMEVLKGELDKAAKFDTLSTSFNNMSTELTNVKAARDTLLKQEIEFNKVQEERRNLANQILQIQLDCKKEVITELKNLMMAVFRNPTYTTSGTQAVSIPSGGYAGSTNVCTVTTRD